MNAWSRALVFCSVALAVAACGTLGGYAEAPKVSIANIKVLDVGLLEQKLGLTLRVQNPNERELPIKAFNYDLLLNGQPFASGVSASSVTVPAFGNSTVDVEAFSNIGGVLRQFAELRKGGLTNVSYRIKGRAILSDTGIRLPFDFSGEIGLPDEGKQ